MPFTVTSGTVTIGSGGGGGGGGGTVGQNIANVGVVPLNAITLQIYERGSTTPIIDSAQDLIRAQGVQFDGIFPGGQYGKASFFVPRDPTHSWPFKGGQRLVIRNGLSIVWEGFITNIGYMFSGGAEQGRKVEAVGGWEWLLGARGWNKPWADNRMSDDVWPGAGDYFTIDRQDRLKIVPRNRAMATNDEYRFTYIPPTGETVKRVTFDEEMQEGAQNWLLQLYDADNAALAYQRTANGSSSQDNTLATPSDRILLRLVSNAAQTPTDDAAIFARFSNIMVRTETGNINAQEIAKDIRARHTDLNSDETLIGALTLALEPFITNGWERLNSILQRAVSFGDASFNSWYARLVHSEKASTPNGEPVLEVAQYPALTDYDYEIRADDENVGPFQVVKDYNQIWNWIIVRYRDATNNRDIYVTPDDDVNLKDVNSVTDWGQREFIIDAGNATAANAKNWARRFLAQHKDPKFFVSGPITVTGYVRGKNGNRIPAANIEAGKRLKIANFLTDEVGVSGAGLTFHVTQAQYTDADQSCAISTGKPDNLAVFLAQVLAGLRK